VRMGVGALLVPRPKFYGPDFIIEIEAIAAA
jgi:hypothetical protein